MYQIQKTAFDLAWSYWKPFAVFAAIDLGVFDNLHESSQTISVLSKKLKTGPASLQKLMGCLAAIDLVETKNKKYVLTSLGHCFAAGSDSSIVNMAKHFRNLVPLMSRISESVSSGKPLIKSTHDIDYSVLLDGMDEINREDLAFVEKYLAGKDVLEVGPGSGKLAYLAKDLVGTMFLCDKPDIVKNLKKLFKRSEAIIIARDYLDIDINLLVDRIVMSQVLHSKSPEEIDKFLEKAVSELVPGGLLMIREQFKELSRYGVFFALNMQVCSGGDSISYKLLKNKMKGRFKGIKLVRQGGLFSPFAWLVGTKRGETC